MGLFFKIPALILYFIAGLWGIFVCLGIEVNRLGFVGDAIEFFLEPAKFAFAPWYHALSNSSSNWFLLLIGASISYVIGAALDGD